MEIDHSLTLLWRLFLSGELHYKVISSKEDWYWDVTKPEEKNSSNQHWNKIPNTNLSEEQQSQNPSNFQTLQILPWHQREISNIIDWGRSESWRGKKISVNELCPEVNVVGWYFYPEFVVWHYWGSDGVAALAARVDNSGSQLGKLLVFNTAQSTRSISSILNVALQAGTKMAIFSHSQWPLAPFFMPSRLWSDKEKRGNISKHLALV